MAFLIIDNFLGFEELDELEYAKVKALRRSVDSDDYVSFNQVFGE